MTGFQIFLCVIAGIILFFILLLSIPVHVSFTYTDKIYLSIRYLFIKLDLLPLGEKKDKQKKETPPKEEKPKEEKPEEETVKEKKPNPILEMIKANGYDGMMQVLSNLKTVLGIYGGKLFKSVIFDEIELYITVGSPEAAKTALKYGKTCQAVFPLMGLICNNNVVKKYDVNVEPDFLANNSEGEMNMAFHLIIRKIINATLAMVVRLVFKVVLKFLSGAKKNKRTEQSEETPQNAAAQTQSVN